MQKINPLLDQTSKELKKSSSELPIEAGQTDSRAVAGAATSESRVEEPGAEFDSSKLDHVDAINQIFAEFEFAYHNQFHKAFADAESLVIAKKYWLGSLEHFSPLQIVQAAKSVIASHDYLPTISVILRACERGHDLFGLPSPRQAYIEACSAASPKRAQKWSHEAVYYAGKATGWYLLANEPEASAFPLFEYHYDNLCKRVMHGEELALELPEALPEKIERKLDSEEAHARIAKMKQELGL